MGIFTDIFTYIILYINIPLILDIQKTISTDKTLKPNYSIIDIYSENYKLTKS